MLEGWQAGCFLGVMKIPQRGRRGVVNDHVSSERDGDQNIFGWLVFKYHIIRGYGGSRDIHTALSSINQFNT